VLTEGEVMAAIFAAEGSLDLGGVEIVERRRIAEEPEPEPEPAPEPRPRGAEAARVRDAPPVATEAASDLPDALRAIAERGWAGADWVDAPTMPPPERAALTPRERAVLAGAGRAGELPTLRIRGLGRADARVRLEDFVSLHRAAGRAYIRVITGKGVGSPGEPVLKHLVAAWCAGAGAAEVRGLAPEREASLEYGALILQLRRARRSPRGR
jgi:hypothetical protein